MIASPPPPIPPPARSADNAAAYLRLCGVNPARIGDLSELPVEEIQARLDRWIADIVPAQPDESPLQHAARGRAQLLLARAPSRWPDQFLRTPASADLSAAVRAVALQPKRTLRQTGMTPQPIDLGPVSEVAHETWKTFDTWPVLRGLTLWLLFSLLLAAVFYVVRF